MMFQEGLERCWMRNKDFYLGILEDVIARMEQLEITVDELSLASGLEPKRLIHIFDGMIEDLTLLELDNLLTAVRVTPTTFAMA